MAPVSRWIRGYAKAWRARDAKAVASLFADNAVYSSQPFRPVETGRRAILNYTIGAFDIDEVYEVSFGKPVVQGARAAVEYWGEMKEHGKEVTIAGCVMLRFDRGGLCNELRDYWTLKEGRVQAPTKLFVEKRRPSVTKTSDLKDLGAGSAEDSSARASTSAC